MSLSSTSANYGGRVNPQQSNVKQFVVSSSDAQWIYKRVSDSTVVLTPAIQKYPVYINNNVTISGDLTVMGSIYNPSDERLKNNIHKVDAQKILTLNPVSFAYKNDRKMKTHYGFLAQEVEKVFPELVDTKSCIGYKSVNYQEMIPLMLAKMKTMQDEIDELKTMCK
jgi:hypothetical protein